MLRGMEIRPVRPADLDALTDIDGTVESSQYLHLDRSGEGFELAWKLTERPLRERRHDPNRLDDERRFLVKQVATGADEGTALMAEHDGAAVALMLAMPDNERQTIRVLDLRVDYDHRREGLATAMIYQVISEARAAGLRAVMAESKTDNVPAAMLLSKCGFDIAGLDARRYSNHDLVKEAVALYWYAALD